MYFCDDIYSLIKKCISYLPYNSINKKNSKVIPEHIEGDIYTPSKIREPGQIKDNYNEYYFIDNNLEDSYLINIDKLK